MKSFNHINTRSIEEACELLGRYKGRAMLIAGGTDLLSALKGNILNKYPEAVINVKSIPGLDYIIEEDNVMRIGALVKISDIVMSPLIRERYKILSDAAHSVATPGVRNMATLGGNLCQDVRCWYYRYPLSIGGPITCLRKGKGTCLAISGDNRYHAIIGGRKCFAVCPSDTAVALAALNARIIIFGPKGEKKVAVEDFYNPMGNALEKNEMVREVEVPRWAGPSKQKFIKYTLRKPIDFAIVSVASIIALEECICSDVHIALGAVASAPVRAKKAEEILKGYPIEEHRVENAAEQAVSGAKPLSKNAYKIELTEALIKKSLLSCFNQ